MHTTKKKTDELDRAELQHFADEHVAYELGMLVYSVIHRRSSEEPFRNNMLIEANLLHARNLAEFFLLQRGPKQNKKNARDDDVRASCYFAEKDAESGKETWPPRWEPKFPWDAVDKRLAHLTVVRMHEQPHPPDAVALTRLMAEEVERFNVELENHGWNPIATGVLQQFSAWDTANRPHSRIYTEGSTSYSQVFTISGTGNIDDVRLK